MQQENQMNPQKQELFSKVAQLLSFLFNNADVKLSEDAKGPIFEASPFLVFTIMDAIVANDINYLGVMFEESTAKYDQVEKCLEFNIVLSDDVEILAGIQLMHSADEDLPEQKDEQVKNHFKANGIRGVYVHFKTTINKNGEEIAFEQGLSTHDELLHPHIVNKLSAEPRHLN
jgi:hypothetical protein